MLSALSSPPLPLKPAENTQGGRSLPEGLPASGPEGVSFLNAVKEAQVSEGKPQRPDTDARLTSTAEKDTTENRPEEFQNSQEKISSQDKWAAGELAVSEKMTEHKIAMLVKEAGQVPKKNEKNRAASGENPEALKDLARKMDENQKKVVDGMAPPPGPLLAAMTQMAKPALVSSPVSHASSKTEKAPSGAQIPGSEKTISVESQKAAVKTLVAKANVKESPTPEKTGKSDEKGKKTDTKNGLETAKVETTADKNKKIKAAGEQNPSSLANPNPVENHKAPEAAPADKSAVKNEIGKSDKGDMLGMPTVKQTAQNHGSQEVAQVRLPHQVDFVQTVSAQIRFAAVEGKDTLTVKLQPENLGKMTITLGREEGGLFAGKLTVESEAVKQLLESQMSDLKDHLEHSGISFDSLTVDVKQDHGSESQHAETARNESSWTDEKPEVAEAFRWVDLRYSDRQVNVLA